MNQQVKTVQIDTRKLWMSRKEACQYLGVSKDWLEACEMAGLLDVSKVRNTIFYIKSQIDNMIRAGAISGEHHFRNEK